MRIRMGMLVAAGMACFAGTAHAQVVGTFSWQTQPHCNRVTLTLTQQGAVYQLTGVDDQCGAGSAPVYGTALATTSGVNLGFSVALGTGRTSHLSASVSLATVSGTWADGDGNAGAFVFNGAASGGSPRPAPAAIAALATIPSGVTVTGEYVLDSHQPTTPFPSSDVFAITLPGVAPVALTPATVNFAAGSPSGDADPACTGSYGVPTAPRGKVCIYVSLSGGLALPGPIGYSATLPTKAFHVIFTPSTTGGDLYLYLTWAYTAP